MFDAPRIPVVLLTGHLGSGKTTLLNNYLAATDAHGTAVIINEFGAVGLDHHLVRQTTENVVLLENGCICCTVRSDLVETLKGLLKSVQSGDLPHFDRVVIETTGLADPVPVIHSMMNDLQLMLAYEMGGIVTLVDGVVGRSTISSRPEAARQVALADCLLITKSDLASEGDIEGLRALLSMTNPAARMLVSDRGAIDRSLFEARLFDPRDKTDVEHWLHRADSATGEPSAHAATAVRNFCVTRDVPLDWEVVSNWVDMLVARHGPRLLRVKGLLNVGDAEGRPWVLHGIQHLFHPPEPLADWPSDDHRSRIVFIVDGIEQAEVEALLQSSPGPDQHIRSQAVDSAMDSASVTAGIQP